LIIGWFFCFTYFIHRYLSISFFLFSFFFFSVSISNNNIYGSLIYTHRERSASFPPLHGGPRTHKSRCGERVVIRIDDWLFKCGSPWVPRRKFGWYFVGIFSFSPHSFVAANSNKSYRGRRAVKNLSNIFFTKHYNTSLYITLY